MQSYVDFISRKDRSCAIVAHRGIWRHAPENSLAAIEAAIAAGCDVVEIDVRRSADGEFVLLHDDTLERMAGLDREPESLPAEQLRGLMLRDRDGGDQNRETGEELPSLKQVFDLTRNRIHVHLDIKHGELIPEVLALARSMGVASQVDVWRSLKTAADLSWIRQVVTPHQVAFIAKTHLGADDAATQLDLLFELSPPVCEIYFDRLDQLLEHKALFDEAGIALWVNTLDDVSNPGFTDTAALSDPDAVWGRLIAAGISLIQTDEPEALKTYLAGRSAGAAG